MPLTEYDFSEENPVDRIFYGRIRIEKATALLYYGHGGLVKTLVHSLKYRGHQQLGSLLGRWLGDQLGATSGVPRIDWVFPVPLHPRKRRRRGYNQCSRFGRAIAESIGARYSEDYLVRTANDPTQTARSRLERWEAVRGSFELRNPRSLEGCSILLADDVITTGATLEACCDAMSRVHRKTLYIAAIAAVP